MCYNIASVLCFGFWPWGMWDLSSLTRGGTHTCHFGRGGLHHWTAREVPTYCTFEGRGQRSYRLSIFKCKGQMCMRAQSCPTPCYPLDCIPPGSSVHGILQARTLEWVAISFSRGSSWSRDQARISSIAGRFFTTSNSCEAQGRM